tara:strand:+ start:2708 stop:3169 length:462 start_codon:yes stop_codon:yes gene_type:complete
MKSTKIEDLIDEGDDSIDAMVEEDINNLTNMNSEANSAPAHEASDELKEQLQHIQNELSDMRSTKDLQQGSIDAPEPIREPEEVEKSFSDIFKIQTKDFKKLVVLSILYGIISSPYVGDMIDNMIPYSLYNYAFVIKLIIFILLYRVLDFFAN